MDWIDRNSSAFSNRSNAERWSENSNGFTFTNLTSVNSAGITARSHGIHPVKIDSQDCQVSVETTRSQSDFPSQILSHAITNIVPSLAGFFSFITIHPRLKPGAILFRPYRNLCLLTFSMLVSLRVPYTFGNVNRRLI